MQWRNGLCQSKTTGRTTGMLGLHQIRNYDELRVALGMERERERNKIRKYTKIKLEELGDWLDVEGERERGVKDDPWISSSNACETTWAIHWNRRYQRKNIFGLQHNTLNFRYIEFELLVTYNCSCLEANWTYGVAAQ